MATEKLVEDQGKIALRPQPAFLMMDAPKTPAILSDDDMISICNEVIRLGDLAIGRMPDMWNQISILVAKNLKLAKFAF